MQRGLATRKLFVCQTRDLEQNWRKFCPDFYTMWRIIYPSFLRRKIGGGYPFYLKFWVKLIPLTADFQSIFARSASAVTPSKKLN